MALSSSWWDDDCWKSSFWWRRMCPYQKLFCWFSAFSSNKSQEPCHTRTQTDSIQTVTGSNLSYWSLVKIGHHKAGMRSIYWKKTNFRLHVVRLHSHRHEYEYVSGFWLTARRRFTHMRWMFTVTCTST